MCHCFLASTFGQLLKGVINTFAIHEGLLDQGSNDGVAGVAECQIGCLRTVLASS